MKCIIDNPTTPSRAPEGPLAAHRGHFARSLREQGYTLSSIVLLLARLGLRAGEVVSPKLEDMDWNAGNLTPNAIVRAESLPLVIGAAYRAGNPRMTACHPSDDGAIKNWLW